MPFDTQPRERNVGTGRACRASSRPACSTPPRELAVFRALQLARFTTDRAVRHRRGRSAAALARVAALDADAVLAALDDPATEDAYQADRALVRTAAGSPTEFQGKAAEHRRRGPLHRALALFEPRDGRRLEAGGFQPVEAYDVVHRQPRPGARRAAPPAEDPVEVARRVPLSR